MAGQSHPCKQKNLIQDFLIKRCINPKRISKIDSGVTNKIIMTFAKGDLPWNWEKSAKNRNNICHFVGRQSHGVYIPNIVCLWSV